MQSSNAPSKIQLPFAASGTKNTIPVPSQQGITPGAASFTDGFPPLTFTPKAAGGIPPAGADINGVLNALSAIQLWQSSGGFFQYDATQSAAIGGYPKGAILLNATWSGFWISTAENNATNPDTGGAGWVAFMPHGRQIFTSSGTFAVPLGITRVWVSGCAGGGGGGGGGGCASTSYWGGSGGGGGAGQGAIQNMLSVVPGNSYSISIGAGGNGGAGAVANGSSGTAGGTTSFGSILSLSGGSGGGNGATASGASSTAPGGNGGAGYPQGSDGASTGPNASFLSVSGAGASSSFGGGGSAARTGSGASGRAGSDAAGFGGGGGGGGGATGSTSSYTGGNGGNGAPGIIVVEW